MNRKTISIISYFTIIGWIIAFAMYYNGGYRSLLVQYHLKQSFGLGILSIFLNVLFFTIFPIISSQLLVFTLLNTGIITFLILGIMNAANQKKQPVPLIGSLFVDRFYFI
ncbi:hypothetical protein SAMN05443543_1025 [Flavobacterium flevense]|nr:hypothetical protein SAMN05443543_1025 [Flavobacterium flevense]